MSGVRRPVKGPPTVFVHRLARATLSLCLLALSLDVVTDWAGRWMGFISFALGVGAVIMFIHEQKLRRDDEAVVLDLNGRASP